MAIPPDVLGHSLKELRNHGFIGVNVTVPHKEAVIQFVRADPLAQMVGAINTIDFRENIGTNTDVAGFMDDLRAHDVAIHGERVVVLGAGGAARAVVYGLARAGAQVAVVNRSLERAQALARTLLVPMQILSQQQAYDWQPSLIVNCTPVGLHPEVDASPWLEVTPLPVGVTVYDTIYRPARTRLMQQVEGTGGRAINGMGMLARQGAAAFKIWTGQEPPVEVMLAALRSALREPGG
jgi:shikimate dehydrogenase